MAGPRWAVLALMLVVATGLAAPVAGAESGGRRVVVGFLPYWTADGYTPPGGVFSEIVFFGVPVGSDGSLDTSKLSQHLDDIARARQACGCMVRAALTIFDRDVADRVLAYHRDELARNIERLVRDYQLDGVLLDWEFIRDKNSLTGEDNTDLLVALLQDLRGRGVRVSIAVAGSVEKVYRDSRLAGLVDYVFLMGYDYHYAGSSRTGPVSPLLYSGLDVADAIDVLLQYYPPGKVVLGLPLYGYDWPAESCQPYAPTTGRGRARTLEQITRGYYSYGVMWDPRGKTPWIAYQSGGCRQIWFDNETSLALKIDYALSRGLAGYGFWALGYADGSSIYPRLLDLWRSRTRPPSLDQVRVSVEGRRITVWVGGAWSLERITLRIRLNRTASIAGAEPGPLGMNITTATTTGSLLVLEAEKHGLVPGSGATGSGVLATLTLTAPVRVENVTVTGLALRYNPDRSLRTITLTPGNITVENPPSHGGGGPPVIGEPPSSGGGGGETSPMPGAPTGGGRALLQGGMVMWTAVIVGLIIGAVFLLARAFFG